jgi:hypothetical protein
VNASGSEILINQLLSDFQWFSVGGSFGLMFMAVKSL